MTQSDHDNSPAASNALRSTDSADQLVELSAIAGGLAHEIRNALSTLRMNLQLLDEDWGEVEADPDGALPQSIARRSRTRVATVLKESQRLETILDDFLEFVRRRELKLNNADLCDIVADLVAFFRPQAERHGIELRLHAATTPVVCQADVGLLKQSLLNVLINAQQALDASDGEQAKTIDVTIANDDQYGIVSISDTGPGIDPEHLKQIFQAYFSTRKAGSGLGLAMARRILRAHGGRIEVDSTVGQGTTFTFRLPLHAAQ